MILILDDDASIRDTISDLLDELDIEALQSNNPKGALKIIAAYDVKWVFTDICMPGINGIELIREIKKIKPHVKFFCISGVSDILEEDIKDLDIVITLQKPFSPKIFKEKVKKAMLG